MAIIVDSCYLLAYALDLCRKSIYNLSAFSCKTEKKETRKWKTTIKIPGKGAATASMVLGIISVVLWFFGYSALVSVILGIVGLILAGNAKKAGFVGGIQTAGFVLSLIGLIGGAIFFVACIACVGAIGAAGTYDAFNNM